MPTLHEGQAPVLPPQLTSDVQCEFLALPNEPSPEEVGQVLTSEAARILVGAALADINDLDSRFALSGTGGFYHSLVARGPAGRIKLHLFAPPDICSGEEAPHTHKSLVIPAVYRGRVTNTLFGFHPDPNGDMVANLAPAQGMTVPRSDVPPVVGNIAVLNSEEIQGNDGGSLYSIRLGQIHNSSTASGHAVTLCYFGPQVAIGERFASIRDQREEPTRGIKYRPKDMVKE